MGFPERRGGAHMGFPEHVHIAKPSSVRHTFRTVSKATDRLGKFCDRGEAHAGLPEHVHIAKPSSVRQYFQRNCFQSN